MNKLNIQTLLMKNTKKCNATCTHCSAIKNKDKDIDINNAKLIIDKVAKYVYNQCSLIFHGGEPMLRPPEFYQEIMDYINRNYPNKFTFSMQSNFLLYNSEWQELIEKYKIGMSTSYDFFSDIRNLHGDVKKYYDIWYKNIKTFQENMSKFFNQDYYMFIINIVNKQNYKKVKEIYEIAKKEKFNIRHNYFYKVGRGDKNSDKYYIEVTKYRDYLVQLFDLYYEDLLKGEVNIHHFKVYPINYYIEKIVKNEKMSMCPWLNVCGGTFLNVEANGKLYNCSEMADVDLLRYGNIYEIEDLIEITKTEQFKKIYERRIKLPKECIQCKYLKYCQGGCMRDSYINEKNFQNLYGKTWACEAWYGVIDKCYTNKETIKKIYIETEPRNYFVNNDHKRFYS